MLLFSFLFLLCVKFSFTLNTTPVFLIDNGIVDSVTSQTNPFKVITSKDFDAITNQVSHLSKNIILFIEETFSVEDISCKDNQGTPYVHLHKYFVDNKAKYFPKVQEPYELIERKFESFGNNTFHLRDTTTRLYLDENYRFTYVYFEDSRNETRVQALRRHDAIMREILFSIKQLVKGPVTAMYTGVRNPSETESHRRRMNVPNVPIASKEVPRTVKGWLTVQCGNGTFRFYDCRLLNGFDARVMPRSCYRTDGAGGRFTYTVVFDSLKNNEVLKTYHLIFYFRHQDNPEIGWKLNRIQWTKTNTEELGKLLVNVSEPWDKFYHNLRPMSITPAEWFHPTLMLTSFKIEIAAKVIVEITETTPGLIEETTVEYSPEASTSSDSSVSSDSSASKDPSVSKDPSASKGPSDSKDPSGSKDSSASKEATTPKIKNTTQYIDWEVVSPSMQTPSSDRNRPLHRIVSPGLISAILISVILLSILGWGINMLSCVQANDRIDSTEKKSLSVADIID